MSDNEQLAHTPKCKGLSFLTGEGHFVRMVASSVLHFSILFAVALVRSIAAERVKLPSAVVLTAGGVLAAALWHVEVPFAFGPALLFVFLPPLIFEAAWTIDLTLVRKHLAAITFLALPGTVVGALVVGGVVAWTGLLPWSEALLLAAIVSATDPVAVTAVFRSLHAPRAIRATVEAESIGNDGVGVVLYGIALALTAGAAVPWYHAVAQGTIAVIMGCVVGVVCAVPLWLGLAATESSEYEVAGTVALAYVSYLAAASQGWSGIFASASAAVALRVLQRRRAHLQHRERIANFWHAAAYMTNAVVFLATGMSISVLRIADAPQLAAVVLVAIVVVRAGLAFIAVRERAAATIILTAGVRGALPLALALALPPSLPHRDSIVDAVFAVVIVTLVVQGGILRAILRWVATWTRTASD
ncbi:MAG TPA: cation:proton antiporter [Candidatus Tumulicola sp.]